MAAGIRAMWCDGCAHVTLAPEVGGTTPFIRQLRAENVLPALAHTMVGAAKRVPDATVFAHWHGGKFDVRATLHGKCVLWAK
jgi:N-acetylglucosamine-6-phosphate deacetylase